MSETLSSRFQKSMGAPIDIDGIILRPSYRLALKGGSHRFLVRRLKAKAFPLQGLRMKAQKGDIEVNGQRLRDVVLWADTSPELVEIAVSSKNGCELIVWNSWQVDGLTQAWVGNAGLSVAQDGDAVTLSCSDGVGAVNLSDLVVQIHPASSTAGGSIVS
ncbi:MAG: hypothetical protein JSR72_23630 [Proteobacteria bacterium]|nr:hypothetical protein [Pseudomonadota bacterium]